jgi:hypothetical protein
MVTCGVLLGCSKEPASTDPPDAVATEPSSLTSALPPVMIVAQDTTWKLLLELKPAAPRGELELAGEQFTLSAMRLDVKAQTLNGVANRDGATLPAIAHTEYRLRFALDECEHPTPTPPNAWPGLCGQIEGLPPPKRIVEHELLVDVDSAYWATGEVHQLRAACVPRSGAGPSCQLWGSTSTTR